MSRSTVMSPSVLADDSAGAALLDSLGSASNVLYAPDVSSKRFDAETGYQLFNAARRLTATLATMASPPRLFMLTREAVSDEDRADPAHAILWGLGRTLALEHPEIWGGVIELGESVTAEHTDVDGADAADTSMPVGRDQGRLAGLRTRTAPQSAPRSRRRTGGRGDGAAVGTVAQSVGGLLRARHGFADERGTSARARRNPRRMLAQSVVFDYPTVEALADYLATIGDADQELAQADLSERVN